MGRKQHYMEAVRRLAELKSDQWVSNNTPEHVHPLIHLFIDIAEKDIQIVSSDLKEFDTAGIASAMEATLRRGTRVKIIAEDISNEFGKRMTRLSETLNVVIKLINKIEDIKFCIVDGKAIRCTTTEDETVLSFHQPEIAKSLIQKFNKMETQ